MEYKLHNGSGGLCCKGCSRQDKKLNTYDWLADIPGNAEESDMVEVQFKNTRKGYFRNSNKIKLEKGDVVAVEAAPGHDIGVVTLTGRLVPLQMKKANFKADTEIKRVYRKAKPVDMEKFNEAKAKEHATMIRARQIALNLNLDMKIGDVEYQGDGNKAIFYYIADERVDFRQLIKVLAEAFRVRIEMKQIGARQEAGRIGGIGPCGRELCCATWMTSFVSVSTSAARFQDISLNPQKLAGQCAKLKCCLNYEVDCYVEAQKRLPSREIELETKDGTFYFFKADILSNQVSYSTDKNFPANLGDGNKAIFYYIADERVDFRQLIKVLAEAFRVRIEMKQIGARQEAGRIGGIGPCGRELCCATWMTSFVSVSTSAARFQDISLNPQKLAGQCAKLKCCLNYEVDCYVEAQKRLPSREIELETKDGTFYFFKADILSNQVSYSTDKNFPANLVTISGKRAFEVISMNKKGMKPDSLLEEEKKPEPRKPVDLLEQESVTRFDRSRNNKEGGNNANRNNKKKKKGNNNNGNRPQQQAEGGNRPQQPQRENENRPQQSENGNRGERDNRPRNNNNNNRNRGQNQGRNNENRRPERGSNQERPQGQERSNQERPQQQDRQREQQGQERQERRPNHERPSRPERNQNQEKQSTNEKPTQE